MRVPIKKIDPRPQMGAGPENLTLPKRKYFEIHALRKIFIGFQMFAPPCIKVTNHCPRKAVWAL